MLIRSQDNKTLFNFTQCINIGERRKGAVIYVNNLYPAGEYSTAEKALKVLDMIQDAYMEYKSGEIVGNGLAGSAYTGNYDTKESVAHGIAVLKGYGNEIRKSILFQMPEDSEVEA